MINNWEKGKLKLSLKKEEILCRTDTTTTDQEGIMQSNQDQITIKWSKLYSESHCIKYWKKSRTNLSSIGKSQERIFLQMAQQDGGKS